MPVDPATLGGAPTPAQGGNLTVPKTNEQREEHIVFQRQARVLAHVGDADSAWAEKGDGPVNVLLHKEHAHVRVLCYADADGAVLANFLVHPKTELRACRSDRALMLRAFDFSGGERVEEVCFCFEFGAAAEAGEFRAAVEWAATHMAGVVAGSGEAAGGGEAGGGEAVPASPQMRRARGTMGVADIAAAAAAAAEAEEDDEGAPQLRAKRGTMGVGDFAAASGLAAAPASPQKKEMTVADFAHGHHLAGTEARAVFDALDAGGDGQVNAGELLLGLKKLPAFAALVHLEAATTKQALAAFHAADADGDGKLSWPEFEAWARGDAAGDAGGGGNGGG